MFISSRLLLRRADKTSGRDDEIKPTTPDDIVDREVAVAIRRRQVATKDTRSLHDGDSANFEESGAIARNTFGGKTTKKTSELQEVASGDTKTRPKKRRSEIGSANGRGAKDEAPKPKMRRVELKFQAVGPADAFEVSATLQSHATGNWKNKNSGVRKAMARGEMHRATSVKNAWLLDVIKALFKRRSSVIANVPSRMAFVDRHRSCFQPTTHSDWPQRRSTLSRNRRNNKSKAQKIALGGPTLEKRCVSEIDFDSSVVASARSSSALQISGTKDVTRLGGVIRFVKTVVHFVIFLVPRAWRILIAAFR
ncbi:hypothetical protein HPB51_006817 [Rhipicephalus microplus]|uniref:Uncharacterized protein n=1 Tax=Rhipicephalus microplus TaxID=6941 RepID=A0A9J6E862_RHIMP|nr:hypothetical protein HPB51_006817 [Rhipicephalus microplus]